MNVTSVPKVVGVQEDAVVSIELVGPGTVRGLACPYCGRPMPLDEAGMVAAQAAWGWCGALAIDGRKTVGLLLVSATASSDPRATVTRIGAGWVTPGHTRRGTGRALLHALAGGLHRARVGALFATADPLRRCAALPSGFLESTGFVATTQARTWRLDLNAAVPAARSSVRVRLERLVQAVRPVAPPEPAGRDQMNSSRARSSAAFVLPPVNDLTSSPPEKIWMVGSPSTPCSVGMRGLVLVSRE